jgi:hypothetical protein
LASARTELASGVDNLMKIGEGCIEAMNAHRHIRQLAVAIGLVTALGWMVAHADIYTWTDASGNVNLSNRPPPEGARVTNVYREDPAVHATAEAARAAAARDELKALNERVTQLERDLDAANDRPPPAPIVYAPAPPPTVIYPPVIAQTIVVPSAPAYADCSMQWGGCAASDNFGFYPGVVVVSVPASQRFNPNHRGPRVRTPPSMPAPLPVGAIPDPVNLFPNTPGRR